MHISNINIKGYKNFKETTNIKLNKGLNLIVGENGAGKTTIINALRLIMKENEFSYMNISEDDFYTSIDRNYIAPEISIDITLENLSPDEKVTFLTWCDKEINAKLHLTVNSNPNRKGYYKKEIWGGTSKSSIFEEETFECIDCIYLPPLRNAEEKLINGRKSRLAQLLKKQYGDNTDSLVQNVSKFNQSIADNSDGNYNEIEATKLNINKKLKEALGDRLGQSINLQFAETNFNRIVESIKMVFFPSIDIPPSGMYRDISLNSLGYNNLLYIATVLAELELLKDSNVFTILLIEEPEAHLHPQLQVKFIKYLEEIVTKLNNIQIILTTHSSVLASSVSIDKLVHLSTSIDKVIATPLKEISLGKSKHFINRWLDITKSTLLFSKGIILVEGICEAMLLPALAKITLAKYNSYAKKNGSELNPYSLEEAGVSTININGINFTHFMKLFANFDDSNSDANLPIFCSGITDNDPAPNNIVHIDKNGKEISKVVETFPTRYDVIQGENPALKIKPEINKSTWGRLFSSPYKTFEYDLLLTKNIVSIATIIKNNWPSQNGSVYKKCEDIIFRQGLYIDHNLEREDAIYLFKHIDCDEIGKAFFAQELASYIEHELNNIQSLNLDSNLRDEKIELIFQVPNYIQQAILWACHGGNSENG